MIDGVMVKKLKVIPDERGRLMEMLRRDDPFFEQFGQCYLTTGYPGVVKAWHYHKGQTDHFICVSGMAKVALYDPRENSPTKGEINEFFIGDHNPCLIRIPANCHHGWKCVSEHESIVVSVPTEPYDYARPDEYRLDPHGNGLIAYQWDRKDG